MKLIAEQSTSEVARVPQTDLGSNLGRVIVIPGNLLRRVAVRLTEMTQARQLNWQRERHDAGHYQLTHGAARILVRYHTARIQENTIELTVKSHQDEEIGSLVSQEDEGEGYEILAALLFAIQREENRGNIRHLTDELIRLLPESERGQWGLN